MIICRLAGAVTLVTLAILLALQTTGGAQQVKATANPGDGAIQNVNLSDQGFGVAWTTLGSYTGSTVLYGTTCASATNRVSEVSGNGDVHLAAVSGLKPNTKYYYKLDVNGVVDSNNGACYTATTFASQARPPVPAAVYGQARNASCGSAPKALW